MLAVIGIIFCLYVAIRCLELVANERSHDAVRVFGALLMIGAMIGAGLVYTASRDASAALEATGLFQP
jgi:hypothetical protein